MSSGFQLGTSRWPDAPRLPRQCNTVAAKSQFADAEWTGISNNEYAPQSTITAKSGVFRATMAREKQATQQQYNRLSANTKSVVFRKNAGWRHCCASSIRSRRQQKLLACDLVLCWVNRAPGHLTITMVKTKGAMLIQMPLFLSVLFCFASYLHSYCLCTF